MSLLSRLAVNEQDTVKQVSGAACETSLRDDGHPTALKTTTAEFYNYMSSNGKVVERLCQDAPFPITPKYRPIQCMCRCYTWPQLYP